MSLRTTLVPALALAAVAAGCNFDAAYARYCEGNAACEAGGGSGGGGSGGGGGTGGVGGSGGTQAEPRTCRRSFECGIGFICLPEGHVCAKLCETPVDCPDGLDLCEPFAGDWRVCACSGAAACVDGTVCNPVDRLCEPPCAEDADCADFRQGRVCDRLTGACVLGVIACTTNADCTDPSWPRCDTTSQHCSGCLSSDDCRRRPDGRTACDPRGACVFPGP